jgi:hypothetical protein
MQIVAFINDIICYRNMKTLNNFKTKAPWRRTSYHKYSPMYQKIYFDHNRNICEIFGTAEKPFQNDSKIKLDFITTIVDTERHTNGKMTDYWNTRNCTQNINSMLSKVQCM